MDKIEHKNMVEDILKVPAETRTIEFKRLGDSKSSVVGGVVESIVAMANTDGGYVLLGVDDPEKTKRKDIDRVFGIEENLEIYDELGREITKFIKPPLSSVWPPVLIPVEEKGVRIAVIEVPKVGDHFREINGHAYVRGEKGNRLLTPHEIVEFAYVKGFKHADRELVTVDFDRLDTDMFRIWRKARGIAEETVERVLVNVGLAAKDEEGVVRPTRASVMLFADYPTDLMETKCAVRVFQYDSHIKHFKGDTYNYVGVPKTINAPTLRAIEQAQEYVLTLLRKGIKVGSGFTTTYQVPERAVKEAITNAVIHRDYHTKRDVEVHIFEDRIEIESPGLLPFNITPGNIGYVRATGYRNDLLVKHLREFPDAPNLDQNEGVRKMRESMLEEKLYPPIFITYPHLQDGVRVILLNESAPTEWDKVIQYLEEHKAINNAGARKLLGMADTSAVSRLLTRWTAQGLLVKVSPQSSSKRFTMYRLPTQKERLLFATSPNK